MRSILALLLGICLAAGCDIREATLVDMALDMEMPATICIRVLTKRTGEWALSNPFPEVWTAKLIRDADLGSDNTVVCLHNRTTYTEYVIACRGTYCSLPIRLKGAIEACTFHIAEMKLKILIFTAVFGVASTLFYLLSRHYETRPLPSWVFKACCVPLRAIGRLLPNMGKKKDSTKD